MLTKLQLIGPRGALRVALASAVGLSLYGIWWGWVEAWNPDQMALISMFRKNQLPFRPTNFESPPFYTYVNFFVSALPVKCAERVAELLTGAEYNWRIVALYLSRLLQVGFFAGIVVVVHAAMRDAIGRSAAVVSAFLLATSAGFVLEAHFLTTDISVTFFMLVSFWLAQRIVVRPSMRRYLLAGLMVGVATATKYNGLAVGLAIPIFHLFANPQLSFRKLAFDPRLVLGVSMVIVGFFLANPFAAIEFKQFTADFMYNFRVIPVYGGPSEGFGFGMFALRILEAIGLPLGAILAAGVVAALASLRGSSVLQRSTVIAALGVFALYLLVFGSAPRVEVRFVLPVVPFLLIAAGPAWNALYSRRPRSALAMVSLLCVYGAASSIMVGYRFANDPRMAAQRWVKENVPTGSTIESTFYSPHWNQFPGIDVDDKRVPFVSGRRLLLSETFMHDPKMLEAIRKREANPTLWYDSSALWRRAPDFVAVHTQFAGRFQEDEVAALYPGISAYLRQLLDGELGYEVVFDRESKGTFRWLYPKENSFIDGRMVILRRVNHDD